MRTRAFAAISLASFLVGCAPAARTVLLEAPATRGIVDQTLDTRTLARGERLTHQADCDHGLQRVQIDVRPRGRVDVSLSCAQFRDTACPGCDALDCCDADGAEEE